MHVFLFNTIPVKSLTDYSVQEEKRTVGGRWEKVKKGSLL